MATKSESKMESQDIIGAHEGSLSTTDKTASAPKAIPATTAESSSKPKKRTVKFNKKNTKERLKKGKKSVAANDSSTDSSKDETVSDDDSTEPDTDSEGDKKRRVLKKQLDSQKSKKKAGSTKKTKKQISKALASSDSDSDVSDDEALEDSDVEDAEQKSKSDSSQLATQKALDKAQFQVLQLQLQLQQQNGLNMGNGLINNASGLNAGGLNSASYSGYGGLGNDASYGSAGLGSGLISGLNNGLTGSTLLDYPYSGQIQNRRAGIAVHPPPSGLRRMSYAELDDEDTMCGLDGKSRSSSSRRAGGKGTQKLEFRRVDQIWNSKIHNYKLKDTVENVSDSQYDDYIFHVRRTFDWEGKYRTTIVDIKSKALREVLQDAMPNIKGVSLVEETPKLDPNMLFLYLEDFRELLTNLKELEPDAKTKNERKKVQKWINKKRQHLKVLVKYLDKDYAQIKKSLYPLLENGLITFDLLWALWKPSTPVYTTTYGSPEESRVFKVDIAEKHFSIVKGDFYYIEGKYFEYDGKQFGYGSLADEISDFRGARKITSLACYPLKYHKNEAQVRKDLIERGKKFVALGGVHYKSHQGMAYYKKKKAVVKVNINGRIMVDPSIHRRSNPNYPISLVRPKDHDILSDEEDSDEEGGCGCESDGGGVVENDGLDEDEQYVTKVFQDKNGDIHTVRIPKDTVEESAPNEKLDKVHSKGEEENAESNVEVVKDQNADSANKPVPEFTDEEYLIASPLVLGFAFAEKLWLEFTVSGVKEISWNEQAYDSLVLEPKTKNIVKALVESHKYHAAESIDDVIQGKGKGLIAVLHGPPGTGKTLTAEGISELLKCPLYMVSAGDLGTDSRYLEAELQKILDICHAWGAILLLDEADVFLEKRNMHDIHRNALVSIFLKQLEYFQGILFLTTNRVETFDDAFQSRIHIALRYDDLDHKARKTIFKIFIERVRVLEKIELMPFTETDYTDLAKHSLNGRQIKNTIRTAQALAVNRSEPLSMRHIREVLDVLIKFEQDLKGGPGYEQALMHYH